MGGKVGLARAVGACTGAAAGTAGLEGASTAGGAAVGNIGTGFAVKIVGLGLGAGGKDGIELISAAAGGEVTPKGVPFADPAGRAAARQAALMQKRSSPAAFKRHLTRQYRSVNMIQLDNLNMKA